MFSNRLSDDHDEISFDFCPGVYFVKSPQNTVPWLTMRGVAVAGSTA